MEAFIRASHSYAPVFVVTRWIKHRFETHRPTALWVTILLLKISRPRRPIVDAPLRAAADHTIVAGGSTEEGRRTAGDVSGDAGTRCGDRNGPGRAKTPKLRRIITLLRTGLHLIGPTIATVPALGPRRRVRSPLPFSPPYPQDPLALYSIFASRPSHLEDHPEPAYIPRTARRSSPKCIISRSSSTTSE